MQVNHKQLEKSISKSYSTGIPLFISGTTGIGKSVTVSKIGREIASREDREYVEWNRISSDKKAELESNADARKKVFILADLRVSQLDPSDLRGLPSMRDNAYVEWKPSLLFKVLSLEHTRGILFFDEINLAPPSVQASAYQIILDKCIGEISLNPDICIIGAGNRLEDKANVFDMAAPLKNRFASVGLNIPTKEEWVGWALNNSIDNRIVSYIEFRPSHLMADISKLNTHSDTAFASPRSWEFCSRLIEGEENIDDLERYASSAVGDGVAIEFKSFLKLRTKIDINKYFDKPEEVKGLGLDMKWCMLSLIADKYKSDKKSLDKALEFCKYFEPDFSVTLLRMLKQSNVSHFFGNVDKCKNWDEIAKKFAKYLTPEG